jgi:hypothetical protein
MHIFVFIYFYLTNTIPLIEEAQIVRLDVGCILKTLSKINK